MGRKIKLFLVFSVLLLTTMCRWYDPGGRVTSTNGLSCQNYMNYGSFEEAAECSYICPDGTIQQPVIAEKFSVSSPLYSASKEELDGRFCANADGPRWTGRNFKTSLRKKWESILVSSSLKETLWDSQNASTWSRLMSRSLAMQSTWH